MRVITNAKSVAATQNDPFYRSSLADHTRRQIQLLQQARITGGSTGVGEPVIASQTPFSHDQQLPIIVDSPVTPKLSNLDYAHLAHEAIRIEPSPLDISASERLGVQKVTGDNPTLAPQQDISPISVNDSSSDPEAELVSPSVSNVWQLDPTHDLANIGLAFGLNTAPMSPQHPTSSGYGWNTSLEPTSAPHDRTAFRGDRQDNIGTRNFYPGQSYPPPLPSLNTGFQPYTLYPPAQNPATTPRDEYSGIDPARLTSGPGGYARSYEPGSNHSRPSPLRSPTQSPMAPYGLAYGDSHGHAGSSAGSMSAREPNFPNSFGNYANGRLRRHSDDIGALDMPRFGNAAGKRKATWSGGDSDLASIKQELEDLAATEREVAELKNDLPSGDRKERRRIQNKLAQRAFRARSKVHSSEVSKHINDLEDTVDSQADHIDKLMGLVERLQTENMLLRKATDWSSLGIPNETPRLDDRDQAYRPLHIE